MAASIHRCPQCKTPYTGNGRASVDWPTFPFCSKRCQMIDLGKWFDEEYRISEPVIQDEDGQGGPDISSRH